MNRVVVTGLGVVAPNGNDMEQSWHNTVAGKSGIRLISLFDTQDLPVKIAGEVTGFDPTVAMEPKEVKRTSRFVQFATVAAREALMASGLNYTQIGDDIGCSIGVGLGGLQDIEDNAYLLRDKGSKRISPFFIPYAIANMAAGHVSTAYSLRGPNMCTTTACASGTHSVGEAFQYIRFGRAKAMVCGGAESTITPLGLAGFNALKALCRDSNDQPAKASRPFDASRSGFVMGEGAGILVLEELEHAKARGANIYAEVKGYGLSGDGHHITAPAPDGQGGQRCMRMALKDAKMTGDEVDYINAHGTSTKLNDHCESVAIERVFGQDYAYKLKISSTKGVTGHCIAAAGAIEAIYSVLAIKRQVIPPTINLNTPDPECPLNYTPNEAIDYPVNVALSNSFGFGGTNASIIFQQFQ